MADRIIFGVHYAYDNAAGSNIALQHFSVAEGSETFCLVKRGKRQCHVDIGF